MMSDEYDLLTATLTRRKAQTIYALAQDAIDSDEDTDDVLLAGICGTMMGVLDDE